MQSQTVRVHSRRALRAPCPKCGRIHEIHRMREHLRDGHHLESSELEAVLLQARRDALRGPGHS